MSAALQFSLRGVGLVGPGFDDWARGRALLADPSQWAAAPTVLPPPARLPPAERRRAGAIVKACLAAADQAAAQAGIDVGQTATVFSASVGDGPNCHALCEALATPERLVSPTRFTNSVHNASAGYWHIATACRAPSTSLSAHDASFAAGLLEAASQSVADRRPVLLVVADAPYPEPLRSTRPIPDAMALALVLDASHAGPALARLSLQLADGEADACAHAGLEALRRAIPAARALPLLQRLARGEAGPCTIGYHEGLALRVAVEPAA
ncbi:MAG: beta-ketoacyl synthase chain length factor [Pseudomonadota bacterium]